VQYALPNLERILLYQARELGPLQGAIAQNSFGSSLVPRYMPYYIARCVPGLVQGYHWNGAERYLEAARLAMEFVLRQKGQDGGLLPAVYPNRQSNRWPQWTAALGDVLLAADLLGEFGLTYDLEALAQRVLDGQDASGGIQTGRGFDAQAGGMPGSVPDFRDLLHVAGWCDKTFLWLARHCSGSSLPEITLQPFQTACTFQGLELNFFEDKARVQIVRGGATVYLWIKGEAWGREASPEFWLH
jgi:hypothetical protein